MISWESATKFYTIYIIFSESTRGEIYHNLFYLASITFITKLCKSSTKKIKQQTNIPHGFRHTNH